MKILGIETSCDETAASIIEGKGNEVKVISNIVFSQIKIHAKYGGVVPEVAAREHVVNIIPVIEKALKKAKINPDNIKAQLDGIAVTIGPGLITSLQVGVETAKVLSYVWGTPLIAVNHIEGHIYSNFINVKNKDYKNNLFPVLNLVVSGGHTSLVLMKGHGQYKIIGETLDDAAGEAFDKAAKMLGLGYPGGSIIAKNALLANKKKIAEVTNIKLPRPMLYSPNFNFSFSGLKTALLYTLKKDKAWKSRVPEYCFEFEQAIVDTLIHKTLKAAIKYKANTIMLAGGVSCNEALREQLAIAITKEAPAVKFYSPDLNYTTDNAAMIATIGYFKAQRKEFTTWNKISADCNLEL
ncbi:MAG: tRNA (adenosine(37)-N6)-threonylcarbamoyltransferase complex transferase subunit TsaD [Candidatus Falkowbacteria bacterium]|nr:tRNA (adenosine(37)-N6)-threonylcarbamoyltransferase complex transferase subunit TsaD [Candidatus Falkowbacteria bacterium]